jgi:DNA-binding transcriptional MerR regulator
MNSKPESPTLNLRDYVLIKDAAAFLGVSAATLRNWERAGKVTAYRNPINGYRLFRKMDLDELLTRIQRSGSQGSHDSIT